jgi:hypothetical protein
VEFLDDGAADRIGVFALDNNRSACAVDDFLHQHVAALICTTVGLADVLVAEIPKNILDYVLEFEA